MSDIQEEQKRLYKRAEENDLLREIKKYKEIEKYLIKENKILQDRIDEAIEYIETYHFITGNIIKIYNILKGDNK